MTFLREIMQPQKGVRRAWQRPQHAAHIEAASDFFKMTKAFPKSTLNSEPDRDDEVVKRFHGVRYWPFASFCTAA